MTLSNLRDSSNDSLVKAYAEAAAAHERASFEGDYRTANKQYGVIEKIYSELKEIGTEGQRSLLELFNHSDPFVQAWAASHALEFAPEQAQAALEDLARSNHGLASFTAEMTLSEWKKGHL